jgi:hypothetical protein
MKQQKPGLRPGFCLPCRRKQLQQFQNLTILPGLCYGFCSGSELFKIQERGMPVSRFLKILLIGVVSVIFLYNAAHIARQFVFWRQAEQGQQDALNAALGTQPSQNPPQPIVTLPPVELPTEPPTEAPTEPPTEPLDDTEQMLMDMDLEALRAVNPDVLAFYHSDGVIYDIIPELIEIGVDVLNPIQPECVDPVLLKQQYGDKLSFWGTIGTQTTMPFGTPEEVRETVRHMIETVGKGGGLVIAPTHLLEPEVPWENIEALVKAVRDFGTFA